MKALWDGDEETASRVMTDILFETISYDDYHENYYHAFLTEITWGLEYVVKSNQENGLGRSCIDARDKYEKHGMILEAKKSDKEEDMEKDALEGKQQIIEKEYLRGFTGYDSVICYGISFFQKKALVRKMTFGWTSSPPFRQRLQTDDRSGCVPGAFTALSACTGDEAAYQKELLSRKEP